MKKNTQIGRLEHALLETGMMNELFVQQIKDGTVDAAYVSAALQNFRTAMNPEPLKVQVEYVVGFLFNHDASKVLLVMKNRPAWQTGLLNGVGGKVEPGETPLQAMEREFQEETYFKHREITVDGIVLENAIQWEYVGHRFRDSVFVDGENGSYSMSIFAAYLNDIRECVYEFDTWTSTNESWSVWSAPEVKDPNRELVIALPLNREILARRGVPGLAGTVDLSLQAMREGFTFAIEDPAYIEHFEGAE